MIVLAAATNRRRRRARRAAAPARIQGPLARTTTAGTARPAGTGGARAPRTRAETGDSSPVREARIVERRPGSLSSPKAGTDSIRVGPGPRTPGPRKQHHESTIRSGRESSAASTRRTTRSPTGRPPTCSASPRKAGTWSSPGCCPMLLPAKDEGGAVTPASVMRTGSAMFRQASWRVFGVASHRRARGTRSEPRPVPFRSGLPKALGDKPAYSLWPHSVRPLRRLAGGRAPL